MKNSLKYLLLAASCMVTAMANAEVAVIVHAGHESAPSKTEISNIFLGRSKSLGGVDQSGWSPTKDAFYSAVTGKNEAQLKAYWAALNFTGKGQPLPALGDDSKVVEHVASTPGSIGYVDSTAVTGGVKVVLRLP